jgi:hypothetical protein
MDQLADISASSPIASDVPFLGVLGAIPGMVACTLSS